MSDPTDKDWASPVHWGEVPYKRSHLSLLRHIQAVSKQGSLIKADGVPDHQRTGKYCGGCYHGYEQYHEGHSCWE